MVIFTSPKHSKHLLMSSCKMLRNKQTLSKHFNREFACKNKSKSFACCWQLKMKNCRSEMKIGGSSADGRWWADDVDSIAILVPAAPPRFMTKWWNKCEIYCPVGFRLVDRTHLWEFTGLLIHLTVSVMMLNICAIKIYGPNEEERKTLTTFFFLIFGKWKLKKFTRKQINFIITKALMGACVTGGYVGTSTKVGASLRNAEKNVRKWV